MRVEKKVIDYTLKFCDREIRVLIECLKSVKLKDCRDQSLAWDLLNDFEMLFGDDKDDNDDRDYEAEIIADVMRKPSPKAIERNKKAQELLRKLRGN